jgi:type VI secretion system protein ImpC
MNISKKDLHKTLKRYKGAAWDQSPIFKKTYEEEYGTLGGEPFGCLVGDYYFDHSPVDVEILGEMSKVAAAAHAPFIAASSPTLFQMETWQELSNPRDLTKIFSVPEYAGWRSLRESEDARYLGLCMPRFLARTPYGAKTNPVEEFNFEEDSATSDSKQIHLGERGLCHGREHQPLLQAVWLVLAHSRHRIGRSQWKAFPPTPSRRMTAAWIIKCPTEIAISDRREAELAKNGFMPLVYKKNSDFAAFIGAQSLQKPAVYDDPDATSNAALAARLPYLFATCRFAHYLKCIVRDKIGSFRECADMQSWLQTWITGYVDGDPAHSSEETKASKPLAGAEVVVEPIEGNPGYYQSKFFLRPHYQLEGLTVSLRLVSKLPSAKGG